ncbi:hypothetical protein M422DRAFT_65999 [Sphaerobolus stellatus SS14]|nr:hypothetical protein M422DRAFT_65999 [Sphaerobolus stellatus SS14]
MHRSTSSVLKKADSPKTAALRSNSRNVSWHASVTIINDEKGPAQRSYSWRSESSASSSTSSTSSQATCSPPVSCSLPPTPEVAPRPSIWSPLHPLLSPDNKAVFDIRLDPTILLPIHGISEPATLSGARCLRLVSPHFPWTLEVRSRNPQGPITCSDIFFALHTALSLPLTNSEWSLADDARKNSIMRANRNRRGGSVRRLRRIDWLGSKVYFKGLTKDDGLGRSRLLPEDDFWPDTWVVRFGSH